MVGKANHVLDAKMTNAMLTPGKNKWGLGVETGGSDANPYFTHGGVNEGFQSLFVAYEKAGGDGAVVMTNSVGGLGIAQEVMRSIAAEYAWPDFQPSVRTLAKVDRSVLQRYVGTYMATPTFSVVYTLEGDQLFAQASGQEKYPIYPEGQSKFFMKVVDAEINFHAAGDGGGGLPCFAPRWPGLQRDEEVRQYDLLLLHDFTSSVPRSRFISTGA